MRLALVLRKQKFHKTGFICCSAQALFPIGTCNARDRDDKGDSNRCRNRNSVEHRMSSHQLAAFWPYIKQCTEDEVKFTPLGSCTKITMRGFILLAMELMMCRAVEEACWEMVLGHVLVSTQLPVVAERNYLTWLASI